MKSPAFVTDQGGFCHDVHHCLGFAFVRYMIKAKQTPMSEKTNGCTVRYTRVSVHRGKNKVARHTIILPDGMLND